jgi:hypothetical protein
VAIRAARRIGKVTRLLLSLERRVNPDGDVAALKRDRDKTQKKETGVKKIQRALVAARPFRELA